MYKTLKTTQMCVFTVQSNIYDGVFSRKNSILGVQLVSKYACNLALVIPV